MDWVDGIPRACLSTIVWWNSPIALWYETPGYVKGLVWSESTEYSCLWVILYEYILRGTTSTATRELWSFSWYLCLRRSILLIGSPLVHLHLAELKVPSICCCLFQHFLYKMSNQCYSGFSVIPFLDFPILGEMLSTLKQYSVKFLYYMYQSN